MSHTIPVFCNTLLVILLYLAEKHTPANKLPQKVRQLITGVLFGLLCIYTTNHSIAFKNVNITIRDSFPLCAGLIFGAPSGVIAGVIGSVYRFIFGASDFTRVAGSISTLLAGLIAAMLRLLMFDDKKPTWVYGIGIALVCEDIHMLTIFLLNLHNSAIAFEYVQQNSFFLLLANSVTVGLALFAVSLLSQDRISLRSKQENITQTFQRWLLVCIVIAYSVTSLFTYQLQSNMSQTQIQGSINQTIKDVYQDILDTSDAHLLEATEKVKSQYLNSDSWDSESLLELANQNGVIGINVFGEDGIITNSSLPELIGFDMNSGTQSAEFMCLFEGESVFVQEYQPISADPGISRKYAAVLLPDGTALQVGYSYEQYKKDLDDQVFNATKNRHVGNYGYVLICDENWLIVADGDEHNGMNLNELGISIDVSIMQEGNVYQAKIHDTAYLYSYLFSEGYCIIGLVPEKEANYMRDASIYISIFIEILIFATLYVMVYFLVKRAIINNLRKVNSSLSQITGGNLNVKVDVRSSQEFASLSDDINTTVSTLKRYIAEAASRIDKELEYAKQIQYSALPSTFPPYPEQDRFDIFARMYTAKEVGGDFYDFYMLDRNTVAFLIADVSGKGIPAALFMMRAKTTIKDLAEQRLPANEILQEANERLCEGNQAGMFVTACIGIVDLHTGKLQFANAGHNPPLLRHRNGSFEFLKVKAGFVLAGMEGVRYRLHEIALEPGDRLFLYTDGVTEATDLQLSLYGEERLQAFLNSHADTAARELLPEIKKDIDTFAGTAPQFDDITMLMYDYYGGAHMQEKQKFPADVNQLPNIQSFFEIALARVTCPMKIQMAVSVAIEEVFVNIAHYAYPAGEGMVTAVFSFNPSDKTATFQLRDQGIPFDPLQQADPDIALSAEQRQIGGLGIFITKKTMDSVTYQYENGENVLTMKKHISKGE